MKKVSTPPPLNCRSICGTSGADISPKAAPATKPAARAARNCRRRALTRTPSARRPPTSPLREGEAMGFRTATCPASSKAGRRSSSRMTRFLGASTLTGMTAESWMPWIHRRSDVTVTVDWPTPIGGSQKRALHVVLTVLVALALKNCARGSPFRPMEAYASRTMSRTCTRSPAVCVGGVSAGFGGKRRPAARRNAWKVGPWVAQCVMASGGVRARRR